MSVIDILFGIDMTTYFPDIPRIFTAFAEWLSCIVCILQMKRHLSGWRLAAVFGALLAVQTTFLALTKGLYGVKWFFCMAAAIALMYFFIYLCCDMGAKEVGYYCVHAFVMAEFAASLEWQIDCFFYYDMGWSNSWFHLFWLVLIYGMSFGVLFLMGIKLGERERKLQVTNKELISCIIIGLAVFLTSNLGFISLHTPFSGQGRMEIFAIRTIIDLGGLSILYAYHIQCLDLRVSNELEKVQNILHNQYVQYQQSQEMIDIINYKYHDLKHHIIALRTEENEQCRNEYLDKMEAEISNYEAQNKTGNKVLDTLLTTKNLYCMKHNISMTCVVDGTLFEFMDVMDICSIFGNALDNAIECEEKIKEKEKRMIHVSAFSKMNFLIIRFENYCEDELEFHEQLPVTTKKEVKFHGYGLKSLCFTVHKYAGEVDASVEDNWFNLKILIPLTMNN